MLPDDAIDRLIEGCQTIGNLCQSLGIQQWEVVASQSYGHQIDIEGGKITLAGGGGEGGFGIRVLDEGRFGYSYLVEPSSAEKAISEAISIAKISPSIKDFVLPSNMPANKVSGLSDSTILNTQPNELLEQADMIISHVSSQDSRAKVTGGGIGVGATATAILTSEGIESSGLSTSHGIGVQISIEENDELTSSWQGESSKSKLKHVPKCVDRAIDWAQKTRSPIKLDDGAVDAPVLLTSEGFSPLFSMVVPSAIKGEKLVRKESFWSDKMEQIVMSKSLSIVDDPTVPGGKSSRSRDDEGVPASKQQIIDSGRLVGSLWSTRDSYQQMSEGRIEFAKTTGSAVRSGHQSPPVSGCSNLFLTSSEGGNDYHKLLEIMEDGFVINSVMGAHTANPTSGDFSVTTSSILRVEGGEVIGAVKQAGVSGNMAKSLASRVYLGDEVRPQGSYTSGAMYLPNVLLMDEIRVNPV